MGIPPNLTDITAQLDGRINDYYSRTLPQEEGTVAKINFMELFVPTIAYVTNALLVDKRLSSDPEWVRQTDDFAVNRYKAADDVRLWPPLVAGIVAPFIASVKKLRAQRKYVMHKLKPLYEELKRQDQLAIDEKKKMRKASFGYEWLWGGVLRTMSRWKTFQIL